MLLSISIIRLPIYSKKYPTLASPRKPMSNISELCGCPRFDEAVGVGILDFKTMTAMRANHIHTLSLVSELMTAITASGRSARHSECRMLE